MMLVTLEEAKNYLRIDSGDEDALIGTLLDSAAELCVDVARLTKEQWADIESAKSFSNLYPRDEMEHTRRLMRIGILYSLAYLYEHREEADHHGLTLTLRAILGSIREAVL